ncbi:MAG: GNAT family N-acetyltransferase [Cellulomonadaceae bacterium]|jgi:GNAT superfamily N-acetyltransferase|nr:GNAT family N-acetyltransferase [Cellulomonadaceae bacterium]
MIRELTATDAAASFEAMVALRTGLADADDYIQCVEAQMRDGYRLVASFDDALDTAAAVVGFRLASNLAWGRFLYIDDLSTLPSARGRGHATALLTWVADEAARLGVDAVHLDSGSTPARHDAHALYHRHGYRVTSFHFALPVTAHIAASSGRVAAERA